MDYLQKLPSEDYDSFGYRMYTNKENYNLTNLEIADLLNETFSMSKGESTHRGHFTSYIKGRMWSDGNNVSQDENKVKPRLVVSDLHLPFAIDGWLEFIQATHAKYGCDDEILVNGDLVEFNSISFHKAETESPNAIDEFEMAKTEVNRLTKAFPNAIWLLGNHDNRIARLNKEIGIDKRFLKTFHQLFNLPETWKVADNIIIDNVLYKHIGCSTGKMGHLNSAQANMMSTCSAHVHSQGGVNYITNPTGKTIFGLNSGCLCNEETIAFKYSINAKQKGVLGCGVVFSDTHAIFEPFHK